MCNDMLGTRLFKKKEDYFLGTLAKGKRKIDDIF